MRRVIDQKSFHFLAPKLRLNEVTFEGGGNNLFFLQYLRTRFNNKKCWSLPGQIFYNGVSKIFQKLLVAAVRLQGRG